MKTINDYLDDYAAARGIRSDYAIAKDLGLTRQALSKYRNNRGTPEMDVLWVISNAIRVPLSHLVATAEMERAERAADAQRRQLWWRRLRDLPRVAPVVFIGFLGVIGALPDTAVAAVRCILCQIAKADPRRPWWHSATIANRLIFQRSKIFCLQ